MEEPVPQVTFDWTITAGNLLSLLVIGSGLVLWAFKAGGDFRVLKEEVRAIREGIAAFITKEVVAEKERVARHEHDEFRRDIEEVKGELAKLRNGKSRRR